MSWLSRRDGAQTTDPEVQGDLIMAKKRKKKAAKKGRKKAAKKGRRKGRRKASKK
jgi:hypothetical protein